MPSGFPTLEPAFKIILKVTTASHVGIVASGSSLSHFSTSTGTLISIPGFTPAINATVIFGADHLYMDPDGSKIRVNVSCIAKTDDDINLAFKYHGTYYLNDAMKQAFTGNPVDGKMPFGQATTYLTFETGRGKYQELQDKTFVGNGRFIVEDGKLSVESRWSAVVSSTESD